METSLPFPAGLKAQSPHILVLEQDPIQAWWLSEALRSAGYRITLAGSPAAGLARCRHDVFDLCLLNHRLRGGDLPAYVHRLYALQLLPVVVLSGARTAGPHRDMPWTALRMLAKPYTTQQLLRTVDECLTYCELPA